MSSDHVLAKVVTEAGYDGQGVLAKSNDARYKAQLRASTKEAKDLGICGVPTYRVFRRNLGSSNDEWKQSGDLVWGQDEIAVVEDMISGSDGNEVAKVGSPETKIGQSRL